MRDTTLAKTGSESIIKGMSLLNLPTSVATLAQRLAHDLIAVNGVRAVVLGGSWARGKGDASSDIDLGIYYHPATPPNLVALRALAARYDNSGNGDAVTALGEWGRWINGGAWLAVGEQRMDWLYRDLEQVAHYAELCVAGKPEMHYQAGHPHGFSTAIYLGEIALCIPFADPHGEIAALKARATPYSSLLQQALVRGSLWEAGFALETIRKSAKRGDVAYVVGGLYRCAAQLCQALFALNEQYCINEKGAVAAVEAMPLHPTDFRARMEVVLATPGANPAALDASLAAFELLVEESRVLAETIE